MNTSTFLMPVVLLSVVGCSITPNGNVPQTQRVYIDKKIERSVDSLLSKMTIDEKIGQLVLYSSHFTVTGPSLPKNVEEAIRSGACGSIFNAHVPAYNRELQRMAVEETRMGIPLLFGYDVIHGMKTIFPINLGMSCSWDLAAIERSARVAAREAIASGINWTFSPMVDVTRDPRWGRVSEGSGEDTYLGSLIGVAMVRGYQGSSPEALRSDTTILACVKHFAAYGAPQGGRDYHTVDISERTLREVYLPPYKAAVDAGAGTVMTAFNDIDAVPATASSYLFNTVLRDEWGFRGFVVTDYTAVSELIPHGVARDSSDAARLAIEAGINMDMQGDIYHKCLKQLVKSGEVSERQIDQMCAEILGVKFAMGLFDDPYRYSRTDLEPTEHYKPEYLAEARSMARKSMVLLKNSGETLPIAPGKRIALIGPFADSQIDLLGSWYGQGEASKVTSILTGMQQRFGSNNVFYAKGSYADGNDRSGFAGALAAARSADVVVMTVGHPGSWSGEATSLTFITIPEIQQELITEVKKSGKPIALVLLNGRPLDLSWESTAADAMLEAWYPGTEGGHAVADLLSGDYNPSGKLTMTFPRSIGQVPIHYDQKNTGRPFSPTVGEQHYVSRYHNLPDNTPLYPFGYGLSYTTFEYSGFELSHKRIDLSRPLTVTVTVRNIGSREGEEIVQMYVRDLVGSVTRPVRQLRGFEKITLKPNESRKVSFSINEQDLSFFLQNMSFGFEHGKFMVWVGGDSDAQMGAEFEVVE